MTVRDQIDTLVDRIESSEEISSEDREAILEMHDTLELLSVNYSDHRRLKLLRHLTILAENVGGVADSLDDREAAEELVRWINRNYENEETNRDYRVALRVFGRHVGDGEDDDPPESLDWIPSSTSSTYDTTPDPREMLRWGDEIQDMFEAAQNSRDAAAIALGFDAGPRGGEFVDIRVGDITDHEHGLQVTLEGKQGRRTVTLIPSVSYVQRWLEDHPRGDDPDAPLWANLVTGEGISYNMKSRMIKDPADRAGIDTTVHFTKLRKSSAAHLASQNMNQAHLEDHHGWVRGSQAAARYISVFADKSDNELARVYGKEVEETEDDTIAPVECPRCGSDTPREKSLCVWCGQALEPGAAERAEALDDLIVEGLARLPPNKADRLLELRGRVTDEPEARAEAIEILNG